MLGFCFGMGIPAKLSCESQKGTARTHPNTVATCTGSKPSHYHNSNPCRFQLFSDASGSKTSAAPCWELLKFRCPGWELKNAGSWAVMTIRCHWEGGISAIHGKFGKFWVVFARMLGWIDFRNTFCLQGDIKSILSKWTWQNNNARTGANGMMKASTTGSFHSIHRNLW